MSKSPKYRNLQKFVTQIFTVKIGKSLELIRDIFEFMEKPYFQRLNLQFGPEGSKQKNMTKNLFANECKATIRWQKLKAKIKGQVLEEIPLCKTYIHQIIGFI